MMKKKKGFTLIELLVVVAIIGILAGIAFISISGAREAAFDTQIRSELGQIRSNAEQYYYNNEGSYTGYDEPGTAWDDIADDLPNCSAAIHDEEGYENPDQYQIEIESGDYAQSYMAWAALCAESEEDVVYYCIDSDGNAGETTDPPPAQTEIVCPVD